MERDPRLPQIEGPDVTGLHDATQHPELCQRHRARPLTRRVKPEQQRDSQYQAGHDRKGQFLQPDLPGCRLPPQPGEAFQGIKIQHDDNHHKSQADWIRQQRNREAAHGGPVEKLAQPVRRFSRDGLKVTQGRSKEKEQCLTV